MSMSVNNRSASAQGSSAAGAIDGQDVKAAGKGKGPEREVDAEGKPVLPWAFIDCDTDDLVVLIGKSWATPWYDLWIRNIALQCNGSSTCVYTESETDSMYLPL